MATIPPSSSPSQQDKFDFRGQIGLVNIGNSCYMNSSLQSLSNCPPFRQYLIDCLPAQSTSNLSAALSLIFRKMWTSERNPGSLNPRPVSSSMKQKMFRGWQQQDAQEFLRCLFCQIHDELSVELPDYYFKYCLNNESLNSNDKEEEGEEGEERGQREEVRSCQSSSSSDESITELIRPMQPSTTDNDTTGNGIMKPQVLESNSSSTVTSTKGYYSQLSGNDNETQDNIDTTEDVSPLNISTNTCTTEEEVEPSSNDTSSLVVAVDPRLFDSTVLLSDISSTGGGRIVVHEELVLKNIISQLKIMENDTTDKAAKKVSIVTEIFQGEFESKVTCLNCSKVSVTIEPFQDLSLPIPSRKEIARLRKEDITTNSTSPPPSPPPSNSFGSQVCRVWNNFIGLARDIVSGPPTSLEDCLESFFDYSDLSGDNRYFCQHCNSLQNSRKEMSILHLPEILCIHLKRFRYDGFFTSKVSRYVEFPMTDLNMKPYLKTNDQNHQYSLISVITHIGGAGGGHYICCAKRSSSDDQWLEYNDARVSSITSNEVQGIEGYLLFYQKQSSHPIEPIKIADIVPLPNTHIPSDDVCYISRYWLLKRNSCVNPGPVVPYNFACEHGGILPGKESLARTSAIPIQRIVWDELIERYGGGPLVTKLETCDQCERYLAELSACRKEEKKKVTEIQTANDKAPEVFLLSQSWLKNWQNFIHCESLEVLSPGPINNLSLLLRTKDDSIKLDTKSQYRYISLPVWKYLHSRYGGGPLITTSREILTAL